jgi:hypothetical protein
MSAKQRTNLFTPQVAEELEAARVSLDEIEEIITDQELRGFLCQLPGPGRLHFARKDTDEGMIYVEYTPLDEATFRTHSVIRFPENRVGV